ncbi:MAG: ABC transporter ATP-binding protein [Candidatus Aminicenantes bacterium]|nr:ABC transporter ATP-binding protein [Candidatus Aminicenantes bacterium]
MIDLKDLHYRLNGKDILKNIDLSVKEGDFWLIFGPNGAGKTTLLKILCGLIHNYEGRALLNGKPIQTLSIRDLAAIISYQPQFEEFTLPISIKDILLAGRYPYKSFFKNYSGEDYRIFRQVVQELNLEPFLDRDMNTLSGGEKKKVILASAFIQDVSIILFDEPFTFLDPEAISTLKKMMVRLNQMGKTLLVVSHDFELLFPIVNKIFALKKGQIIYSGDKVFDRQILKDTYNVNFERIIHEGKEIIFLDE